MNSGQACRPCRGSCSRVLGRGCFGDLPGDEIVVSPPSPIVEPLANARTGRRGGGDVGSEECQVLGAYGRDTVNDNDERLLSFSADHGFALLNTFLSSQERNFAYVQRARQKTY